MADFLTNLWSSVFTPGTTPTLLVATNATFAALQALLFALLLATWSIHFVILSVLCGGLWYSINWFAMELQVAQAEAKKDEKKEGNGAGSGRKKRDWRREGEVGDSADDEGEDTEVEDLKASSGRSSRLRVGGSDSRDRSGMASSGEIVDATTGSGVLVGSSGVDAGVEQAIAGAETRQRRGEDVDRSGEVSTDSEWEKVSQDGDR